MFMKIKDINNNDIAISAWLMGLATLMMILSSNLIFKWFIAEICTIYMIYYLASGSNPIVSVFYYLVSGASMVILVFMVMMKTNLINEIYSMDLMFQILLFLKLGIYPFSNWFICSFEFMTWNQIFLMSTFMKIIPVILFSEMNISEEMIYFLIFCNLILSVESIKYISLKKIFACSSITQNFIFLILIYTSKTLFMSYSMFYTILTYFITCLLGKYMINTKSDLLKLSSGASIIYFTFIVLYMLIPPLALFILKWTFMFNALMFAGDQTWVILFIYMFSNLLMMWNYFNLTKISKFSLKMQNSFKLSVLVILPAMIFIFVTLVIAGTILMGLY